MKKSIQLKMTLILISIISIVIFFIWYLNIAFAEKYYISKEKVNIIKNFEDVKYHLENDETMNELYNNLEQVSNNNNLKIMIAEPDVYSYDESVIFTNMAHGTRIYQEILQYLNQIRDELINEDIDFSNSFSDFPRLFQPMLENDLRTLVRDGYYITQIADQAREQNGLYLFGFTDNNYLVAMRVSIEGIRTSINITARFIAWVGFVAILIGISFIWVYAYRFTKPIKEMAQVANQMANLDFDHKVQIQTNDEMQDLGDSINLLSENLESTIADLKSANLTLQQDIRKKEEIDEMRKEFLSHVSHELKTPIAIIQGYAEGLKDGIADDPESMDFYCDVIMDEAKKMNNMVKKLLTLNQLEFGNTPLTIQRFDLKEMIQNKIQSTQILSQKNNVIEFEEKESVYVWADEFMIEEVFTNYLTNAIHYVSEKGKIRIWFEKQEDKVRTFVYNDGNPIPESELEKLWIKFYKVDKARTREYGGNGIGLSIVAAAMKAHNREYGVENMQNGVAFYFDLDLDK